MDKSVQAAASSSGSSAGAAIGIILVIAILVCAGFFIFKKHQAGELAWLAARIPKFSQQRSDRKVSSNMYNTKMIITLFITRLIHNDSFNKVDYVAIFG